jgi:hypothetical protein
MLFKLFPTSSPPASLREDLILFLNLSTADSNVVQSWFWDRKGKLDFDEEAFKRRVSESSLPPDQFDRVVGAVRTLIESWYRYSLTIEDVITDLSLLGLSDEEVRKLSPWLQSVAQYSGRDLFRSGMWEFNRSIGLQLPRTSTSRDHAPDRPAGFDQ